MAERYYSLTELVKMMDNLVAAMPSSFANGIITVRHKLSVIPAADVVPVVRCEECAYCEWKNEVCTYGWCKRISTFKMRGEYCSDGERRDGNKE